MSRRIDIELTSTTDGGGFTWRAAGAKQPKGVVEASVLPSSAAVGDEFKVEVEQTLDGISVLSVVDDRQRVDKLETLELLPAETDFKPVLETKARGGRGGGRGRNERGGRGRDGDGRGRDGRRRDGDGRGGDGDGRGGDGRGRDGRGRGRQDRDGRGRDGQGRDGRGRGPRREAPPELPQRPKPKRLRPGKQHRNEVLATLPEEQRPIAELAVQGMAAVRSRLTEDNAKAVAEGRPTMPEATVLKMAEDLLPRLRVAEWTDRAEAALAQLDNLDLRDLRSVVAAAADPVVAREESTAALANELKTALATKQEQELQLWFADIDAALAVGRVIRALRLSAQPPKAGVPFPVDIAERLTVSANAALTPIETPERWVATLEAAAFSPIHAQIEPMGKPPTVTDELTATVTRLAPALPQVAAMFDIEVDPAAPFPKPLRPDYGKRRRDQTGKDGQAPRGRGERGGERSDGRRGSDKGGRDGARTKNDKQTDDKSGDYKQTDDKSADDKAGGDATPDVAPADEVTAVVASGEPGSEEAITDGAPVEDPPAEDPPAEDPPADAPVEDAAASETASAPADEAPTDTDDDDSMPPVVDADAPVVIDEAELVAEAAVVEEAEAITEAAADEEPSPDGEPVSAADTDDAGDEMPAESGSADSENEEPADDSENS